MYPLALKAPPEYKGHAVRRPPETYAASSKRPITYPTFAYSLASFHTSASPL